VAFIFVQGGVSHPGFLDGHVFQGIGRTDGTAPHAEKTGGIGGIYFRCAGYKGIESGPHADAVKDAHLGTLPALQTAD
jgi:hypothetical protein